MAANSLLDAFEICAAQVARGRPVDDVIGQYPQFADDLRVLLAVSATVNRYELPAAEVDAARARLQPAIDELIDSFPDPRLPPWLLPLVIVVIVIVLALILLLGTQPGGIFTPPLTPTPTPSPTFTAQPTATLTPTAAATVDPCAQGVALEGPIEAIRGSQIVIFGLSVVVADPSLYRAGMVVRVTGCTCADAVCDAINEASVTIPTPVPVVMPTIPPAGQSTGSGTASGSPPADGSQTSGSQPGDDDDDDDDGDDDG